MKFNKVFILGDSRTGTASMHEYLNSIGYRSIHLYDREAEMLPHIDENYAENSNRIVRYVSTSGYSAFSDCPTRMYYPILKEKFPDSAFILTSRKSVEIWRTSMINYMSEFFDNLDMDLLCAGYLKINNDIRDYFRGDPNFLDLVVCSEGDMNKLIRSFLGYDGSKELGKTNTYEELMESIVNLTVKRKSLGI